MESSLAKAAKETAPHPGPFPTAPLNLQFGTQPLVMHGHGHHPNKPAWDEFTAWYANQPAARLASPERVTLITCNNGHPAMGLFERSCAHLDLPVAIGGQGRDPWDNARDKPQVILDLLDKVTTPYVLYADSRDAIIVGNPERLVDDLTTHFAADAFIFGGDRMNWPPIRDFKRYEDTLPGAKVTDSRYLNGGLWIAHVETAKRIFHESATRPGHPEAPSSEQGILKQLLLEGRFNIHIDYTCLMFQNLGFAKPETLVFR